MRPNKRPIHSQPPDEDAPLSPSVQLDRCVGRFIELETQTWERAFAILNLPFNRSEFLREASQSIDNTIRSAIFYGGEMTIEEALKLRIGAAHSEALIHDRLALLRQYGTYEEHDRLKLVLNSAG